MTATLVNLTLEPLGPHFGAVVHGSGVRDDAGVAIAKPDRDEVARLRSE